MMDQTDGVMWDLIEADMVERRFRRIADGQEDYYIIYMVRPYPASLGFPIMHQVHVIYTHSLITIT